MCLAVNIPLVESGTAGFLGQTSVIIPGKTECFDCTEKEKPKSFPVCTIRTTPTAPVHCVVWAKDYLFPLLFGTPDDDDSRIPDIPEDNDTGEWIRENLAQETTRNRALRDLIIASAAPNRVEHNLPSDKVGVETCEFTSEIIKTLFVDDIKRLSEMTELWTYRQAPNPLTAELISVLVEDSTKMDISNAWSIKEWVALFKHSLKSLSLRAYGDNKFKELFFDKDDESVMNFVASAASIRAHIFAIEPMMSLFDLKALAGNIIPAIATTNAIVAGLIILQVKNLIFRKDPGACRTTFLTYGTSRGNIFACGELEKPNSGCAVCRVDRCIASIPMHEFTLDKLIRTVLNALTTHEKASDAPRINSPNMQDLSVYSGSNIIYDPDLAVNDAALQPKSLLEMGLKDSQMLLFDFFENDRLPLLVQLLDRETNIKFNLLSSNERRLALDRRSESRQENFETLDDLERPSKISRIEPQALVIDEDIEIISLS